VKCCVLYKGDGLQLGICVCYSSEIALNFGLDVSVNNMYDWKGTREEAEKVNSTKAYKTNDEPSR
jgi:hypothetical protein